MACARHFLALCSLSMAVGFSFADTTEDKIGDIEKALKQTQSELTELVKQQSKNQRELDIAKQKLSIVPTPKPLPKSQFVYQPYHFKSIANDFTQRDYLRYPPNPNPPMFMIQSADKSNSLEFHSWIQADQDIFFNAQGLEINNGTSEVEILNRNTIDRIWMRRVRPSIEGTVYDYFQYFVNPDFGLGQPRIYDAFMDINYYRGLGLQIGQQMSLVSGIENYFTNFDYLTRAFVQEEGYPSMMAPDREFGFMIHGTLGPSGHEPYYRGLSLFGFDDFFSYQFAIMSEVADNTEPGFNPISETNFSSATSAIANKNYEGRLFLNPFIAIEKSFLQHLGVGVAASISSPTNNANLPDLYSVGQNSIVFYNDLVVANGARNRIHPEGFWYYGPFGILADWTKTMQTLIYGTSTNYLYPGSIKDSNTASQIQFIYNLTQEDFNLFHLEPNQKFKPFEKDAYGAWQLVFRLSKMNIDSSLFKANYISGNKTVYVYADPRQSVQSASTWSIGVNWFWTQHLRFTTEYDQTNFEGGCSTGALNAPVNPGCLTAYSTYGTASTSQVVNRPAEKVIMQRFQITF